MLTYNKLKVKNKDFRNFYKKETKDIKHKRIHEYDNDKIIGLFLKKVGENIVNKPSGVLIQNIGYFHIYMIPYERVSRYGLGILSRYKITFTPTDKSIFRNWSMDYHFSEVITKKLKKKLKEGYKYYNSILDICDIDSYGIGKPVKTKK